MVESPRDTTSNNVWVIYSYNCNVGNSDTNNTIDLGLRPI